MQFLATKSQYKARTVKSTESSPYFILKSCQPPTLPHPVLFVKEFPLGNIHSRLQHQRQQHHPGSDQAFGVAEDIHTITRKLPESYQKVARKLPGSCQKVFKSCRKVMGQS